MVRESCPCQSGYVIEALCSAFWVHIIHCLQEGDEETRAWLDTGEEVTGFIWWCDISGKEDAQHWRTQMLRVWSGKTT